jgi:recombination protein RecT
MTDQATAPARDEQQPAKRPNTIKGWLQSDSYKQAIAQALPRHLSADRFLRVAITAITKTPELAECNQASFLNQLLTLSQLGLEPDGRRAHLIPFHNNKRGTVDCQLIVDYKGLVELVMRSGEVSHIHADLVCENDEFEYDRGEIKKHKIDFRKPRGKPYAVYALCRFKDGAERSEVMTVDDVESIRKRSRAGRNGPWVTDWGEMAKKTAFRRLSKWLPLSAEVKEGIERDDSQFEFDRPQPIAAIDSDRRSRSDQLADEMETWSASAVAGDNGAERQAEDEPADVRNEETESDELSAKFAELRRSLRQRTRRDSILQLKQDATARRGEMSDEEYDALSAEIAERLQDAK